MEILRVCLLIKDKAATSNIVIYPRGIYVFFNKNQTFTIIYVSFKQFLGDVSNSLWQEKVLKCLMKESSLLSYYFNATKYSLGLEKVKAVRSTSWRLHVLYVRMLKLIDTCPLVYQYSFFKHEIDEFQTL